MNKITIISNSVAPWVYLGKESKSKAKLLTLITLARLYVAKLLLYRKAGQNARQ